MGIIKSLLNTDLYKFTMLQAIFRNFIKVTAEYKYKLRTEHIHFTNDMVKEIQDEIDLLCTLKFSSSELSYLKSLGHFYDDFLIFLSGFTLYTKNVHMKCIDGKLDIRIKGTWLNIMMFEIYIMEIISEVYFKRLGLDEDLYSGGKRRLDEKLKLIEEYNKECNNVPLFKFVEGGGRRRRSVSWHRHVLSEMIKRVPNNLIGTSNIMFAREFDITPIGTMAHEWVQAFQALYALVDSQKQAFQVWANVYRGNLGIALTDTICMDVFLKDFDLYFCKLFDGARHDSGNPYVWCDKLIKHYENFNINPLGKTAVFSDGLTFKTAIELFKHYRYQINPRFLLGTHITNDFPDLPALNHVIKMVKCNGLHVAKRSDSPGKSMCESKIYTAHMNETFNI